MKSNIRLFTFLLFAAPILNGCHEAPKTVSAPTDGSKSIASSAFNTSCPHLSYDPAGVPVISWVQETDTAKGPQMYYAVFSDSAKRFGEAHLIPASAHIEPHGENMPKMIYGSNGDMLAMYGIKNPQPGNPYTGAVWYTRSFDQGKSWTAAQPLVKDPRQSFDQRYFDVALLPDGETGVVWLNNSRPEGSTLYFATTKGRAGFSNGKIIARHTCQCCRTSILVDSTGKIHVAWRAIFADSIRDMAYAVSGDSGRTFSAPVRISADNWVVDGCPHTGPSMAENGDGLHFTWFTMGGGGGVYYCHKNTDGTFSPRQAVSHLPSARHPQIVALPDNDLAIVWDEGLPDGKAIRQRIGLQMRGPDGLLLDTRYVSPDSADASFPQIAPLNDREALLAFTQTSGDKQQVRYRVIRLRP